MCDIGKDFYAFKKGIKMNTISNNTGACTIHTLETLKERLKQIDKALKELRSFHGDWQKDLIKRLEDELERLRPQIENYFG